MLLFSLTAWAENGNSEPPVLITDVRDVTKPHEFRFEAETAPVSMAADALAEHYEISVFVPGDIAKREITGTLRGATLEQSLDVLAFFARASWRKQGEVYYFGGEEPAQLAVVPSAGLEAQSLRSALGGDAYVVGDSILLKTTPTQSAHVRAVVEQLQVRPVLRVRIVVADMQSSDVPAFKDWLSTVTGGLSLAGDLRKGPAFTLPVNLSLVADFLSKSEKTEMKLDTYFELPSGEKLAVRSGSVVERPVYVRPTDSSQGDLVTRYDRLQLGLTVELTPYAYAERWLLRYSVADSDQLSSNSERTLSLAGAYELDGFDSVQVANVNRIREVTTKRRVPVLGWIPLLGRAFRSEGIEHEKRVVMVFLQRVDFAQNARRDEK